LFDDLDAGLEAAIAREEEEAADDLARALRQDTNLRIAMARTGWRLDRGDGSRHLVTELGADYVVAATPDFGLLVPLGRSVLRAAEGAAPPRATARTLIERVREQARAGAEVEISTDIGALSGHLVGAAADHLHLRTGAGDALVAARSIQAVKYVAR
jgi:hypothetical protein